MLTTPSIYNISPYSKENNKKVLFQVIGGDQITANEIEIYNNETSELIYTHKETTFLLEQTIPLNTLTNGIQYKIRLRTYNISDTASSWSDWKLFWCLTTPVVEITNITDGKVNNQIYTFTGTYTQSDDTIQSYKYILYNDNEIIITTFNNKYDGLLTQEITGLQDGLYYKIEIITESVKGMVGTTGKIRFLAEYVQPRLNSTLTLENIYSTAKVKVTANVIQIIGEVIAGTVSYQDDDWVNLKSGTIKFDDGFNISNDFIIKMWCKDLQNGIIMILYGEYGSYQVIFDTDKIYIKKIINNNVVGNYVSNVVSDILTTDTLFVWIKQSGGYIDISLEKL